MSNEELAVRIRAGESGLLLELWAGVRLFALQQANRRLRFARSGVSRDDLMQAAFLALLASLETWKAGEAVRLPPENGLYRGYRGPQT